MARASMTEERKAALMEAGREHNEEKQAQRSKRITCGKFAAYRFDDFNWCTDREDKEDTRRYFPTMEGAVKDLLRLCIEDGCKNTDDVRKILSAIEKANNGVEAAINGFRVPVNVQDVKAASSEEVTGGLFEL